MTGHNDLFVMINLMNPSATRLKSNKMTFVMTGHNDIFVMTSHNILFSMTGKNDLLMKSHNDSFIMTDNFCDDQSQ